jgi:hypothetical protein
MREGAGWFGSLEGTSLLVYKLPRNQSIPSAMKRMRKIVPALGLLTCLVVSPAFAGETSPSNATDYATSVQTINSYVEVQMRFLQAAINNARRVDVETTRLDELIRLQTQQEMLLEKILDNLGTLAHLKMQIANLQQDAQTGRARSK